MPRNGGHTQIENGGVWFKAYNIEFMKHVFPRSISPHRIDNDRKKNPWAEKKNMWA